jgi:hypothetical protein
MTTVFSRRNAFLGWLVWSLAKRRLRRSLPLGTAPRRRLLRGAAALAVFAALGAVWAKRSDGSGETDA